MRTCESNSPADTKVTEGGGAGDAPGTGAESPAAHGGLQGCRASSASHAGSQQEQVDAEEGYDPMGNP